ncbi:unnamed protein product [Rotaria socialis]
MLVLSILWVFNESQMKNGHIFWQLFFTLKIFLPVTTLDGISGRHFPLTSTVLYNLTNAWHTNVISVHL